MFNCNPLDHRLFPLVPLSLATGFLECHVIQACGFSSFCFDVSVCQFFKCLLGDDFFFILDIYFGSHSCIPPHSWAPGDGWRSGLGTQRPGEEKEAGHEPGVLRSRAHSAQSPRSAPRGPPRDPAAAT